jgi:hypothetical protein
VAGAGIALMMAAGHDRPEFFIMPGGRSTGTQPLAKKSSPAKTG